MPRQKKASDSLICGLDVGTTKVTTIIAEITEDKYINIIGEGTVSATGVKRGVVVDIDSTIRSIERSVEKAERMAGCDIENVYVGIGGEHISSQNNHGIIAISSGRGEISQNDIDRVLEAAKIIPISSDRQIIDLVARDYIVDGQNGIKNPIGMFGSRLEVNAHIVTGGISFIQNLMKCVQRTGLVISELVLQPLATTETILSKDEKEIGVAIMDIGGGTTDLAIFVDGSIAYTKVIPIGSSNIDRDIAYGLSTTLSEAERIKKEYGIAAVKLADPQMLIKMKEVGDRKEREVPQTVIAEIIEARIVEIFEIIKSELNKSTYQDSIPAGIILTGGGSLLKGITELSQEIFNIPAKIGYPSANLGGLFDTLRSPIYSTSIGLVVYGARESKKALSEKTKKNTLDIITKIKTWLKQFIGIE